MCIMGGDDIRIVEAVLKPPSFSYSESYCPEFQSIYPSCPVLILKFGAGAAYRIIILNNAGNKN